MINYDGFLSRAAVSTTGSAIRKMGVMAVRVPDMISFAPGYPDPVTFAWQSFRQIAEELCPAPTGRRSNAAPRAPLHCSVRSMTSSCSRDQGRRRRPADSPRVRSRDWTGGPGAGGPGDVVLVDLPAYTGAITAFRTTQATLVGCDKKPTGSIWRTSRR
jgi:DNA-binding transcriptional MocR family regulator